MQKIVDSLVFHWDPGGEKSFFFPLKNNFSICLWINVNANAMKQEYVFSRDEDMTEAKVYFRPQDSMT